MLPSHARYVWQPICMAARQEDFCACCADSQGSCFACSSSAPWEFRRRNSWKKLHWFHFAVGRASSPPPPPPPQLGSQMGKEEVPTSLLSSATVSTLAGCSKHPVDIALKSEIIQHVMCVMHMFSHISLPPPPSLTPHILSLSLPLSLPLPQNVQMKKRRRPRAVPC